MTRLFRQIDEMQMVSSKTEGVVIWRDSAASYPKLAPFHPSSPYIEYGFDEVAKEPNAVYEAVRNCFRLARLDFERFGTREWNPLGTFIKPGEFVVLKPNLVKESHPRDPEGWRYVLTHGSIIRTVADYVWKAVGPRGRVAIADAPQTDSSFERIVKRLGLDVIRDFYQFQGLKFELIDLRKEEWTNSGGVIVERRALPGDPRGYVAFDLGEHSELVHHRGGGHYYGADYDAGEVNRHHSGGRHEYLISRSAIDCDVLFNLPKLKTHKKAGITISLKNLVGVNGDKNWLPHHTESGAGKNGDEHPQPGLVHKLERKIAGGLRKIALSSPGIGPQLLRFARNVGRPMFGDTENVIRSGNWWGNDTLWRMCLDLNKLVLYGNSNGTMRAGTVENRKRHLVLVDGILGGQGRGPMNPDPIEAGVVIFGTVPPSVDAVCAYLMGFNPDKIPIVRQAFCCRNYLLADSHWRNTSVMSNEPHWNGKISEIDDRSTFHFNPHFGWKGRIERGISHEQATGSFGKGLPKTADILAKR
jgi:uncharacterized protein (DUF362 family)